MPARYEAIRDSILKEKVKAGVGRAKALKEAKRIAAATYQATRKPGEPELNHAVAQEKK